MNILVSIVVPVYNSMSFLDKCIQSIVNQTYRNIEIILVNDGSSDLSGKICDDYASRDKRIKVLHKLNGGLVNARKTGLTACTGEFVLYIDGDDWIETDLVESYIEQVNEFDADVVISSHNVNLEGSVEVLDNSLPPGYYCKDRLINEIYPKMMFTGKFSQFGIFSYSWGKLFRRNILLPNQLRVRESITIGEDALCVYPTLLDASSLVILKKPYYHYRQRTDSLIKTLNTIEFSKMENVYKDFKHIFESKNVLQTMLPQLQYYLLSLLIINTEGPLLDNTSICYPFSRIVPQDKLVIYGGGTFGQHFYKKLNKYNANKIVGWIDERYKHYSKLNLPIKDVSSIESLNFDKVVIALIDEDNSNHALQLLLAHGVDRNNIIQVSHYGTNNIQELLSQYKIN